MCSTRKGCVKPVHVFGRKHLVSHVSLVNVYMLPLSTLRFVASYSIGKFYLQSVIITVGFHGFETVGFERKVLIVVHYILP